MCSYEIIHSCMSLIQLGAVFAGLEEWLGFSYIVALIVGVLTCGLSSIPLIGPILGAIVGIMGAYVGWEWPLWGAILLFVWWPIVCILFAVYDTVKES